MFILPPAAARILTVRRALPGYAAFVPLPVGRVAVPAVAGKIDMGVWRQFQCDAALIDGLEAAIALPAAAV